MCSIVALFVHIGITLHLALSKHTIFTQIGISMITRLNKYRLRHSEVLIRWKHCEYPD
jgi:hypothetical protein